MSGPVRRSAAVLLRQPRAGTPGVTVFRRHAGAQYANFKVKKQNWVEQNEIARENKFYSWTPGAHNIVSLLVMTVAFPLAFHSLYKGELEVRDKNMKGLEPGQRTYL